MKDAIKGYLQLANGLTEVTRQRATAAARALVAQGEATAGQVQSLADDLVTQSKQNRETVVSLVRFEVDKAMKRVGLVGKDEVDGLKSRIKSLEGQLKSVVGGGGAKKAPAAKAPAKAPAAKAPAKAPAKKAAAKKTTAKKTAAKKTTAKKAPAKQPAAATTPPPAAPVPTPAPTPAPASTPAPVAPETVPTQTAADTGA